MNSTARIHACHITRVTPPRFGQQRGSTVIAALLDTGMDYHGIKTMLLQVDALRVAS